jgi:glycerate 2-kinase
MAPPPTTELRADSPATRLLADLFAEITAACDGRTLVRAALADPAVVPAFLRPSGGPKRDRVHVLALGKAAGPMLTGLIEARSDRDVGDDRGISLDGGLVITPAARAPAAAALPPDFQLVLGEHPAPGAGSLRAGAGARAFVAGLPLGDPLVVLLSGGGSALACLPADGLTLADKRAAIAAVATAGAPIAQLNTVRKHLSAIKGGRLGLLARGPVLVLALSDVVGDDPATIASGPFSPDPSSYADALAVLTAYAPATPALAAATAHLREGARGLHPETAKPDDGSLAHVDHRIIAGPRHVVAAAERSIAARGLQAVTLVRDTEAEIGALAEHYLEHARQLGTRAAAAAPVVGIGNGEPRIALPDPGPSPQPHGKGGRATHLALLVARGLSRLANPQPGRAHDANLPDAAEIAFLAAGTDDRDGSGDGSGAVVDGTTWSRAVAAGLDPQAALDHFDSAGLLGALGLIVRGPGTSNLLDVHLLAAMGRAK